MAQRLRGLAVALVMTATVTGACGGSKEQPSAGASTTPPPQTSAPPQSASTPAPAASPDATRPQEPAGGAAADSAAPDDTAVAAMMKPWTGDLEGMVERRYVRMLVTFSKTNYFLDGPTQRGATYDGAKLFEQFLNDRLKSKTIKIHIAFIPVSRDRLIEALAEGRGDIAAASLTITPERQKKVDFGSPLLTDVREVVVAAPGEPPVRQLEDLSGRKVHVRRSSSYYGSLTALNADLEKSGKRPVEIVAANEPLEDEDLLEMVNAGLIPATVVDDHMAALWRQVFGQIQVSDVAVRTGGQIAWALRRNTPHLQEMVNAFIKANPKGSLAYNTILKRYFGDTKWITNAASESEQRKFQNMAALFRRYGDRYNFPWLLLAAQAYQESTIDQSKRSPVGAVGVMQIKPATAAGNPINIVGVDKSAERNVEAGAKYLRFMIDRYYNNEPMDRINKGLFAIASYNAGPARVTQLRAKAQRQGLDRNKWFGNVEVVAAREIGRETVQYVSNIYKYYVSDTLIAQQRDAKRRVKSQP